MSSTSNKPACSRSNSGRSKHSARLAAQTSADAKLDTEFEQSALPVDCSASACAVASNGEDGTSGANGAPSSAVVSAYLQRMQRSNLIQPFGCMIAVECEAFTIIAYSENAPEMLDLAPHAVPSIEQREALTMGIDARTLFRSQSAAALQKAATFADVNLLNPILVHCKNSGKPFYAIMHRVELGLIIDLEPVNLTDVPVTAAGALKSYKLAAKAIYRLQSLPSGDISLLCDVLVREVRDLTGYDRVMAYKFHEDEHGEVISECRRSDLEPYLGLHYPATDIPQASRFLFMKNKVRMICDCSAQPVKVIQDKRLSQTLSLCGSTLRAPHGCHAQYMSNMGSVASLVMSVTISEDDEDDAGSKQQQKGRKLWGLVVCHHSRPRFVPFPLRYACEFLMQVFAIQLNKEVELAAQSREKHILRTQTLLCDMLLRDAPVGIFTRSPNVMDLVKCDGAALYFQNQFWLLGITPTEGQIRDLVKWLMDCHHTTTGLSTDSLSEVGYPGASALGDAVCGIAAIKITKKDFLFWFRSHAAKQIKWGGAKHDPVDKDADDGKKRHPRSSFKAFLEVVKRRSLPWEDVEMDAIHSLQLILRSSLQDDNACANDDKGKGIMNAISDDAKRIQGLDDLRTVANEMVRLIETAVVPIMAVDASANVNGWNAKAAELTGLPVEQAIGLPFIDLVEEDSIEVVRNALSLALQGKEEQNVEIKLKAFGLREDKGPLILLANACCSRDVRDNVVGICFVAQDVTGEKLILDKYTRIKGDFLAIISNRNPLIPPMFIINEYGCCIEWNAAMQNLTGLKREDVIDKMLAGEVFSIHTLGCCVRDPDMLTKLRILLNGLIAGQDSEKLPFGFFDLNGKYVEALLSASKRTDSTGRVTGVFCYLQIPSQELQHALHLRRMSEHEAMRRLKELSYVRREIKNSLQGMLFTRSFLEASNLTSEQKQLMKTVALCQDQLAKVLDDVDLDGIMECYTEINNTEFNLGDSLEAVISQGMTISKEKEISLVHESSAEVTNLFLYGDNMRLQQVLSDYLLNALHFTIPCEGPVVLRASSRMERIGTSMHIVHIEFRIAHPAPGIPDALIQQMFHHKRDMSKEGLCLYVSQRLVKTMNGTVQYLREAESSSFIVHLEFPVAHRGEHSTSSSLRRKAMQ